jgi:hypothetical protein
MGIESGIAKPRVPQEHLKKQTNVLACTKGFIRALPAMRTMAPGLILGSNPKLDNWKRLAILSSR